MTDGTSWQSGRQARPAVDIITEAVGMRDAVDDPQQMAEFAELPDLSGVPLTEILDSTAPELVKAMARLIAEASRPQTTAGFGSFIA
jgi:FXSXX-COOH protein